MKLVNRTLLEGLCHPGFVDLAAAAKIIVLAANAKLEVDNLLEPAGHDTFVQCLFATSLGEYCD